MANLGEVTKQNPNLVYTCNCGWIDLNHFSDPRSRRFIGATNLWQQLYSQGVSSYKIPTSLLMGKGNTYSCTIHSTLVQSQILPDSPDFYVSTGTIPGYQLDYQFERKAMTFPNGEPGFLVVYEQDGYPGLGMLNKLLGHGISARPRFGISRKYLVRCGLTLQEKRAVGLAIFKDVSQRYEKLQGDLGRSATSYTQDDLTSNLLGYFVALGLYSQGEVISRCNPIQQSQAAALYKKMGGFRKNDKWENIPVLEDTSGIGEKGGNPCKGVRSFQELFPEGNQLMGINAKGLYMEIGGGMGDMFNGFFGDIQGVHEW